MESVKEWLNVQHEDPTVLPKSAIGVAVRYARNQWAPLCSFLSEGALPLDNNDTERDLRRITIGRKNWLFLGSPAGGEVAARCYTLIASAIRHDLDVWSYIDDVLRSLAADQYDLERLLPDRWRSAHPESSREYRQQERQTRRESAKLRRARRRVLAKRKVNG